MFNRIFNNNYTKDEQHQMRYIHVCFRTHLAKKDEKELPQALLMSEDFRRPKTVPDKTSFSADTWLPRLDKGLLHNPAKDMVANICAYQTERSNRLSGDGYPDDPINLFCEELKEWCIKLSSYTFDEEKLDQVKRRIAYLNQASNPEIFPQGKSSETTFIYLLSSLKGTLEKEVTLTIRREIANTAARDDLTKLVNHSMIIFNAGVEYLYYIFRDTPNTPTNCTFANLLNPPNAHFEQVIATHTGQCLQKLVKIFQEMEGEVGSTESEQKALVPVQQLSEKVLGDNPFLDSRGLAYLPNEWLATREVDSLADYFRTDESGIEKVFRNNPRVGDFIKLHGLLYEFAKFIMVAKQARVLAGVGGDLLIYGLANGQINQLMSLYTSLSQATGKTLTCLKEEAEKYHQEMIKAKKLTTPWAINYKNIFLIYEKLGTEFAACDVLIETIRKNANSVSLQARVDHAKRETIKFFDQVAIFSMHLDTKLGLPVKPLIPIDWVRVPKEVQAVPSVVFVESKESKRVEELRKVETEPTKVAYYYQQKIDDEKASFIAELLKKDPDCTKVELQKNKLGPEGMRILFEMLKDHPKIEAVNLWFNQLGDEGAKHIATLLPICQLKWLSINENAITADGIRALAPALVQNTTLTFLDLGWNPLGDAGAIELAKYLRMRHAVPLNIRLGNTDIGEEGAKELLACIKANNWIIAVGLGSNPRIPISYKDQFLTTLERNKKNLDSKDDIATPFWQPAEDKNEAQTSTKRTLIVQNTKK